MLSDNSVVNVPKQTWLNACQSLEQHGQAYCIITVVAELGSLPRGVGSKMVVTAKHQFDTLGGGTLEYKVIHKARKGLMKRQSNDSLSQIQIERFSLAADLGQCCGGATQVMFEYVNIRLAKVAIFGAGHVCQSLTAIMSEIPCHLQVVDNRKNWLTPLEQAGISSAYYEHPATAIAALSADTHIVIMSHDHQLDFEIARLALERNCFPFIGLIGSESKKQRFESRLKEQLSTPKLLDQLTCPIGSPEVQGKLPMQVAVSISVQLMSLFEKRKLQTSCSYDEQEKQWNSTNQLRKALALVEDELTLKTS